MLNIIINKNKLSYSKLNLNNIDKKITKRKRYKTH